MISDVPLGSTTLYVALYDADLVRDTPPSVTVVSDSDPSGETLTLVEGADGHFSGTLTLNETTFRIIEDEDQFQVDVEAQLASVAEEYPDFTEEEVRYRAASEVYESYFAEARERNQNPSSTNRDDGVLDIAGKDLITLTYVDALDDWGVQDTVIVLAVYGGVSGDVSGVWSAAVSYTHLTLPTKA